MRFTAMTEVVVTCFKIDGQNYMMEQNIERQDRVMGMLHQYFPDVEIIHGEEEGDDGA